MSINLISNRNSTYFPANLDCSIPASINISWSPGTLSTCKGWVYCSVFGTPKWEPQGIINSTYIFFVKKKFSKNFSFCLYSADFEKHNETTFQCFLFSKNAKIFLFWRRSHHKWCRSPHCFSTFPTRFISDYIDRIIVSLSLPLDF